MYRSATNQIGFATNGVQRMTIGNTALKVDDIHSLSNDNNRLILDDDTNSSQGNGVSLTGANHIYLCPDETNNGTGEVRVIKGTDNDLDSGTATELFRITNAGKVGITEDSIDANLHITGSPVFIKMERAGHRAMRMGTPSNSSLFVFADSDNLQSNQRMVIDNSGLVGIGTTSPYERLYVQCEDATSPAIVSNPSQTNGAIAYAIGYGDANRDYLNTWGMSYSAGANVFGYGVKPSTSSDEAFINSADNSNFKRGALYFDDELKFFNASAITGTIDTAITMTERFRVDADGDGFFDRDVVAFSTTVSDKRLKDNVKTIDNALDKVMSLRGVEFDWNATSRKGQHDIGLIAQEVEEVLPEVVIDKKLCMGDMKNNEKDYKTVDYEKIVGVLVEAIKELKQEIEELK